MHLTTSRRTRRGVLAHALAFGAAAMGAPALAQPAPWPSRPLRIVVAFPAGGLADVLIRQLVPQLSEALGQPVVIENLPGAGGITGTTQIVRAHEPARRLFAAAQVPFGGGMPGAVRCR